MGADLVSSYVPGLSRRATIPAMLAETIARCGERPALGFFSHGELHWLTWSEVGQRVAATAACLTAAGVNPGERVAQWGPNSPAWIFADLAIQAVGAVHVPLHASLPPAAAAAQIAHSESRQVLVAEASQAERLRPLLSSDCVIEQCDNVAVSGGREPSVDTGEMGVNGGLTPPARRGEDSPPSIVPTDASPESLATILYTSGTTGEPRGVMLTQRQLTANVIATSDAVAQAADEVRLCVLPLSHIYARTCDLYSWIYRGTRLVLGESRDTIVRDAAACRPTVMNAVPYLYQKLADAVRNQPATVRGDALRRLLGGEVKRLYAGGAAMPPDIERLFQEAGLPVMSGYGLTEAGPVVTVTTADTYVAGTVGRPLPNLEVRLADDGEVLVRGLSVMSGYWRDDAATAEALIDDSLRTGDLGAWHESGNLVITGRKKEVLVLTTGKKISAAKVEALLVGSPLVEQACVVGQGRTHATALIVPNPTALRAEIRARRLWIWSRRRALHHPTVQRLFRAEIDRCLAEAAPHEQIGQFTLLGRGFSVEAGELTPKLSLRRDVIELRFSREIARMYGR